MMNSFGIQQNKNGKHYEQIKHKNASKRIGHKYCYLCYKFTPFKTPPI